MEIIRNANPPSGLSRFLFRLPIRLYRLGLGWVFGRRILLVNHIGRVTGKQRKVVLEVVSHDADDGSYVVASGWGSSAAWYRNVLHTPDVTIQVGRRTVPVRAVALSAEDGAGIFTRYAARHRIVAKYLLPRLMGFTVDGSQADFHAAGLRIPFIRFVPRE